MAINNVNGLNRISYFDYSKIGAKKEDTTSKSASKSTGTYSVSAEAKASMTQKSQVKEDDVKVEVESTEEEFVNDTGFPDELVKYIRECAVKGAKDGDYKGTTNVNDVMSKYVDDTIGIDRESLKMQMAPYINPAKGMFLPKMLSLMNGFSANLNYGHLDEALFVYNPQGENILTYSHRDGQWTEIMSEAEGDMYQELNEVYSKAFLKERHEMWESGTMDKTGQVPNGPYTGMF